MQVVVVHHNHNYTNQPTNQPLGHTLLSLWRNTSHGVDLHLKDRDGFRRVEIDLLELLAPLERN
jgi:hypothetical protein